MKKLVLTLFALLALVAAPAAAKDSIIAYGNLTTGDFVQIGVLETRSSSEARTFLSISDEEFVEETFGGRVTEVACHDRTETARSFERTLGVDGARCFSIRDWDDSDAYLVMLRQGKLMIVIVTANIYGNDPAAVLSERQLKDIATDGVWDRVPGGFTVMT